MDKPPFSDGHGLNMGMQAIPPFAFEGMTVRAFPLRAKLNIVQQFCDAYLNVAPREVGYFRPYLPYVYLLLVNYGRMSVVVENSGWVAQREMCFTIPLEWYRREGGRLVFHDWAYLSPFIYVDSKLSMTTGREVYGWPKRIIELDREGSHWMHDPRSPPNLASISAQVFTAANAGGRQGQRVVIEVEQRQAPSLSEVPSDLGSMFAPWVSIPQAIAGSAGLMRDYVSVLSGMGLLRRHPGSGPESFAQMARRAAENLSPNTGPLCFNTINLKQFRSADDPVYACYQALTNAPMQLSRFNRGGLLGDVDMLYGDTSGGYTVFVHRFASEPVIELLGLDVDEEWQGDGASVAALKPVFPFWIDVDAGYNLPRTLAFRTRVDCWKDAEGNELPPAEARENGTRPRFNTSLGAAGAQTGGPYDYPDSILRVLPLLADPARLEALCDAYLNDLLEARGMRFEPWGTYVYLVAGNHGASESQERGLTPDRDLALYMPVKWYEHGRLRTLALVPVYAYANNATAAISASEVTGIPTSKATMASPHTTWMDDAESAADLRHYLEMSTELLPVVGEGQRAEERVLVEIGLGTRLSSVDAVPWRRVREGWVGTLKEELSRKSRTPAGLLEDGLALALEVLADGMPLEIVTIKQFRDGDDPYLACYQSLVQIRRSFQHVYDLREMEAPLFVRVHEYESHPIVATLGLVPKTTIQEGATCVHELEPVRPFWIKAALREERGLTICRRAGTTTWEDDAVTLARMKEEPALAPYFLAGKPSVGRSLPRLVDAWAPQRLRPQAEEWRRRHGAEKLTIEQAEAVVENLEPQVVLEAMLSREWEHWGPSRWQRAHDALTKKIEYYEHSTLVQDGVEKQLEHLEQRLGEARRTSRRFDALADLERDGGPLAQLRERAKELGQVEKTRELALYLRDLSPGVAPADGGMSYARKTVLSLDEPRMQALFASDATFQVLEEALRSTDFPLDAHPPDVSTVLTWSAPVKHDDLIRWLIERLPLTGRTAGIAEAVEKIIVGWYEWTIKELTRLFLDEQGHPTRALDALLQSVRASEPGVELPATSLAALEWIWAQVRSDFSMVQRIADQAVRTARDQFAWARAAVVHRLAKTEQKPDFAVPVATLQTAERDLAFPDEECWYEWYVGPRPGAQPTTSVAGVELPLVAARQRG